MQKVFIFLFGMAVLPAFAEVRPVYEEEVFDEVEEVVEAPSEQQVQQSAPIVVSPSMSANRAAQNVRGTGRQTNTTQSQSRAVSARSAVQPIARAQNPAASAGQQNESRPVSSRTAAMQNRGAPQSRAATQSRAMANAIVGGAPAVTTREEATQNQQRTVQARSGSLYNSARAGTIGAVTTATRSSARAASPISTPSLFNATGTNTADTSTTSAEELAAQTDFCKAQYMSCMDNFCNVLDDNQGRCSCSESVKRYEDVENALKKSTEELQDVATKIRYLGLTAEEVKTLFAETAAEMAMQGNADSSVIAGSLKKIEGWLVDPKTATNTSGGLGSMPDLNELFSSSGALDFNSILGGSDSDSIKNQRGDALFNTAKTRCNGIVTECRRNGVDSGLITSSYDLEIGKQCISYERYLTDTNDQMKMTIKNATNVLQQARLMVAQNKNRYDLRGCVNALDSCMQDDFVCGRNYDNCLDASGKYIVSGSVVVGSSPTNVNMRDGNWKYGTACVFDAEKTAACTPATNKTITEMADYEYKYEDENGVKSISGTEVNLVTMLFNRIGYIDGGGRAIGMCSGILNQCQDYTFTSKDKKYNPSSKKNMVINEYFKRTLTNIKARQDEVLASYGDGCRQEIVSCLGRNGFTTTITTGSPVAIKSCEPYIETCAGVLNIVVATGFDSICPPNTSGTAQNLKKTGSGATAKWECGGG